VSTGSPRLARAVAVAAVAGALVAVPLPQVAAWARFGATTADGANSLATRAYYTCQNAAYDGSTTTPGTSRALHYYGLQETSGTAAADGGSTAIAGTYQGTPTLGATGPTCGTNGTKAVTLNGSSQYVTTVTSITVSATTLETWFKTTDTTGGMLLGLADTATTTSTSSTADRRELYVTSSGQVGFGAYNSSSAKGSVLTSSTYRDGTWHLADGVVDASGMRIYVDGALVTTTGTATTSASASGYPRVGWDTTSGYTGTLGNYYFSGSLALASVYSTALTATQVQNHWYASL
jgi:hypothetical protein